MIEDSKRGVLSKETVLPLGIAVSVISIATAAAWNVSAAMTELQLDTTHKFEVIETKIESLTERLDASTSDRWRRGDMATWVELFHARNPDIDIPEVSK